jgi:hypothetical protein
MKIVNLDAPDHLAEKVSKLRIPEFILDVVRPLEGEFYSRCINDTNQLRSPIWKFKYQRYENIATLLHTIPIYLRDSKPEVRDENAIVDLLGAYYSNRKGSGPYIELFLSAIDNSTNNDEKHFKWLFTKVLIHELAHAALDIFNLEGNDKAIEKVRYSSRFGKWREESMANAVALQIIREFGNKGFYNYAKQYMQTQPAEYALGVLMEDFEYWDFRSVFDSKEQGVDSKLKKIWLNYVSGTPDWDGLSKWNELLDSQYVYSFEGKYYSSEEELVYDIVNKVLLDYEHQNGSKMTFATFSSLFPYIRTGAEMSYEPAEKVAGDSRYKDFKLADGDYSLYYFWNNESLHEFIDMNKLKISVAEYNNY